MAEKTVYEIEPEELVKKFRDMAAQAGISGSGLVIDFAAGYTFLEASYLEGAVLARIEGVQPPFSPGMLLKPKDGKVQGYGRPKSIEVEEIVTVGRVFYEGRGRWTMELRGLEKFSEQGRSFDRYPCEQFIQVA